MAKPQWIANTTFAQFGVGVAPSPSYTAGQRLGTNRDTLPATPTCAKRVERTQSLHLVVEQWELRKTPTCGQPGHTALSVPFHDRRHQLGPPLGTSGVLCR